jgi:menaquinone-dependent protoporphyrinogen oxidase
MSGNENNKISRRRFLTLSAVAVGATVVTCSGLGYAASRPPEIKTVDNSFGGNSMSQKILVTYATKAGSTAEVSKKIAQTLSAQGAAVDLMPVQKVTDLQAYSAVVLGSAVRFGQWLPEAVKFVQTNQAALNSKPVAFFAVHLMNRGDDENSRKMRLAYLDAARKLVAPRAEGFFAGVGDLSKVSFLERLIGKAVKSPEGDFRDWPAITAWAEGLTSSGIAA